MPENSVLLSTQYPQDWLNLQIQHTASLDGTFAEERKIWVHPGIGPTRLQDPRQERVMVRNLDFAFRHKTVPGGAHTYSRGDDSFPSRVPGILARARGAYTWSEDRRRYVDWAMAVRSVFIGHANRAVDTSAAALARRGVNLSRPNPEEFHLAETLLQAFPGMEMVKFGKNGSDATAAAIRLARAATGRDLVLRASEAPFLGVHDWFIGSTVVDRGVPQAVKDLTFTFSYGDLADLEEKFALLPGRVAAVILEPLGADEPPPGYLEELKRVVQENGACLVFDEVVSGFRMHYGGYQGLRGVQPDLTAVGKALANGYPLSALIGKRDLMELGGILHQERKVFLMSSTYGPERSGLGAGIASLRIMRQTHRYTRLERQMRRLTEGLRQAFDSWDLLPYLRIRGLPISPNVSLLDVDGRESFAAKSLFMNLMADQGILLGSHLFSPSFAHGAREIDLTLKAIAAVSHEFARTVKGLTDSEIRDRTGESVKPVFRSYNFG